MSNIDNIVEKYLNENKMPQEWQKMSPMCRFVTSKALIPLKNIKGKNLKEVVSQINTLMRPNGRNEREIKGVFDELTKMNLIKINASDIAYEVEISQKLIKIYQDLEKHLEYMKKNPPKPTPVKYSDSEAKSIMNFYATSKSRGGWTGD